MKDSILPLDRFTTSKMESKPRWTWPIMESHARPGTIPGAMILTLKVIKERVWEDLRRSGKLHKNQCMLGCWLLFIAEHEFSSLIEQHIEIVTF